jgi:hypothetical protein
LQDINAQFTIEPGGFVTVKEGGSMMIGTNFHIKSVADSSGYFVDQTTGGDVTITGDITVERYLTPDVWHNVASPVSNESAACYTGTDLVFYYDETMILNDWNFGWVWWQTGALSVFRGYDVLIYDNPVTVNYTATGTETLNTGAYNFGITNTLSDPTEIASHKGWNLAGNPYPSPVDWLAASGWNKTNINDAKYIWDGIADIYTIFVGGGSPIGINGGTRFIPSNQGFWVQAINNGNIGIANSVRVGDITGTPDFYKLKPVDYEMVSLVAKGNNRSDEIVIRFIDGTTGGFDLNYDASKLFSFIEDVPQLSIISGNLEFALQTLPEIYDDLELSLNFQCGKTGFYEINLNDRTNLNDYNKIYLEDRLENRLVNMTTERVYKFYHETAGKKDRFKVYFNPSEDILNRITPASYYSVFSEKNLITVVKNTVQNISAEAVIYNMLGEPVFGKTIANTDKTAFLVNLPNGYYIICILTNQYVSNFKILICN